MPDVKYMGGLHEVLRTASACRELGVQVSPHNPSGPVCHAVSLQVSAALGAFDALEMQFDESPLFDELVAAAFGTVHEGQLAPQSTPGLGIALSEEVLQRIADRPARAWNAR